MMRVQNRGFPAESRPSISTRISLGPNSWKRREEGRGAEDGEIVTFGPQYVLKIIS